MPVVTLTRVECDHVLTLLREAISDGSYYGNRAHYYKRQERIVAKLESAYAVDAVDPVGEPVTDSPRA